MPQYTNIMQYESDIWAAADLLIAAGIKQSKFPDYMMPYFAVMLLESRMLQVINSIEEDGYSREENLSDYIEAFKEHGTGYNEYIVEKGKKLSDICNDKTFKQDWTKYLKGFDNELKMLLGIDRGSEESKYLNISGISAELDKKGILLATVSKWSQMDFTPFDNSEITTLEEHIKRKWADISAETAGEQYTPSDIISLIAEIVGAKVEMPTDEYLSVYDPTCGGGNLLFGVADKLKAIYNTELILTCGCDYNDTLYALASIESRFREVSTIKHGNTLTDVPFRERGFDVVVANPPYGVSWKGYRKDILKDETGQFVAYPSVSDGQLLFMQHILFSLKEKAGLAVEVHNGSTLFSGDAGGGESNIRKYVFDNDWVEAIIQMPSDEFFNTGIYTYLWVMNKNKPADRKDRVILINGSNGWQLLKKSRGSKRREMLPHHRQKIVDALLNFEDCDIAKVFPKWHFYYNKQGVRLTEVDSNGKSVRDALVKEDKTSFPLKAKTVKIDETEIPLKDYTSKQKANDVIAQLKSYNYAEDNFCIITQEGTQYHVDAETNSIVKTATDGTTTDLGCGTFNIKSRSKAGKTAIAIEITPLYVNDYEIIPYHPDETENNRTIAEFMARYITKPFEYRDNTVGVELNFNKEFYVPETIESVEDILKDLADLSEELRTLENEIEL